MLKFKKLIFNIEKAKEFVRNSFSIGSTLRLFICVSLVCIIDLLLFFNLFDRQGVLYYLELSSKLSIITVSATQSLSFIFLIYFRCKDERKEFYTLKLEIYKELLIMLHENNEIINDHFVKFIENNSDAQKVVKYPIYKAWFDIKRDYRGLFVDSLLNYYMEEIFLKFDEYFGYYRKGEKEIKIKIDESLHKYRKDVLLVTNCGTVLYDKIYKNEKILLSDITMPLKDMKDEIPNEVENEIRSIININPNYKKMVLAYEEIKKLHKGLLICIQNRILNYYY